jgi:serine/threonine protein kinase
MEFVEGETLEGLIKRSGRLDVKIALEVTTQVASGLAAVHEKKLVHRDIKPTNIMVSSEEGGAVTAKIIDLGLAKTVHEPGSQTAISTLGGFAGTPEFASPEQFAGVGVDIRSDLYSLGVAWAGAGKSTLVNQWLLRMAAEHYRSAELVFGWSFYRQGTSGRASSADEFLDAALTWFGDPDPRLGTAWEKGERLAKLIAHRRTLLILDGLEPLQNPPAPQERRLRDPSLQALLRGLASFINGLCVITTRLPVADVADRERRSVLRYDLEQLSSEAGAQLLRARACAPASG